MADLDRLRAIVRHARSALSPGLPPSSPKRLRPLPSTAVRDSREGRWGPASTKKNGERAGVKGAREGQELRALLGGYVEELAAGSCLLVRRVYKPTWRHGTVTLADCEELPSCCLRVLIGGSDQGPGIRGREPEVGRPTPGPRPLAPGPVFLDIETTGLSGGAGTIAFLVGLGWFEGGAFLMTQYLLTRLTGERQMLTQIGEQLKGTGTIVTFNGKSFDLPIVETRWLYHRLTPPVTGIAHLDLLHPARRLWWADSCALVDLERTVVRFCRRGDIPSGEIPARYVAYLRTGRFSLLGPVLEHNRLDLLSLAVLTAHASRIVERGAQGTSDPFQCLGLGRLYERAGRHDEASECYRHVAGLAVNGLALAEASADARREPRSINREGHEVSTTKSTKVTKERFQLFDLSSCSSCPSWFSDLRGSRPSCPSWYGGWTMIRSAGDRLRAEALYRLALSERRTREYTAAAQYWERILQLEAPPARLAVEAATGLAIHHEHRLKDFVGARGHARRALGVEHAPHRRRAVEQRLRRLDRKLSEDEGQGGFGKSRL